MKLNPKTLEDIILLETRDAADLLLKAIMDFRRRRRYHRFIQFKPVAPLLMKGRMKTTFFDVVSQLERLRALVFFLEPTKFYRLASEFIISPNNVKFYPVRHVFGEGYLQEEYLDRVEGTITWVCDVCDSDEEEVITRPAVVDFINILKQRIKVFDTTIDFRSKDWYCVKSIARFGDVKGWTEDEFLGKLRNFYSGRRKKVTAEMVLSELSRGDIDVTPVAKVEEKKVKKTKKAKDEAPAPKVAKTIRISELRE